MNKFVSAAVATVALAGASAAAAWAKDIPVNNGSFENSGTGFGPITSWTAQYVPGSGTNYVGVFTSYAGFGPQQGSQLALLSNTGTATLVSLRQAVPVELFRMPFFHFQYMYLTTDPTTTALANRDRFSVVIDYYSDAAGLNQIGSESFVIDTGTLVPTGVNPGVPFNGNVNRTFDNGTVLIDSILPINLITAPYANFTFYLENNGTGSGTSGVLLDNVYINPEPGTMALFGLGAAGLGALVWRRRRSKVAAAAAAK